MPSFHPIPLTLSDQQIAALESHYADLLANLEHKPFLTAKLLEKLRPIMREALESQPGFTDLHRQAELQHTVLHLIHRDNRLLNLPWRLAVEERERLYLTCGVQAAEQAQAFQPQAASPLKILVMVAAPEDLTGSGRLDYEGEEQQIIQAFGPLFAHGQVQIDFTDDGSLESLEAKLQGNRYHILHFSGHGVYREEEGAGGQGTGYLLLEDEQTLQQKLVPALDFAKALTERVQHLPDLVLLSSCQTAQGSGTGEGFRGVANKLLEAGVPAVVAMGFSILDKFATDFAAEFYRQLASQAELCQGFQAALTHIKTLEAPYAQQQGRVPSQWMIPQLYLRQRVDQLVNWQAADQKLSFKSVKFATGEQRLLLEAREGYLFIGRRKERRDALRHLSGEGQAVLLRGMGGVGKTALAEHLLGRLVASDPKVQPFVINEKEFNNLEAILDQLFDYVQFEMDELTIRYDVDDNDPPEKKLLLLLGKISKHCLPVFLFDNLESFQSEPGQPFKQEHGDILLVIQFLLKWRRCPLILTGRYLLAEFPELPTVDLNSVRRADFFKKCLQLRFATLLRQHPLVRKKEDQPPIAFDDLVELLHCTLGGNYRALEFFDQLYQDQQAEIEPALSKLEDFRQKLDAELAPQVRDQLQSGARDLIFDQLYALLSPEERQTLHLLAGFRVPVMELALRIQGLSGELPAWLARLTALTLAERRVQPTTGNELSYYYAPPLVQNFLAGQEGPADFDHLKAGKYFAYLDREVNHLAYSDLEEAFWHYVQAQAKAEVNEIGGRLCRVYYQKQVYTKSFFYGKATEDLLQEETDGYIWGLLGIILKTFGQLDAALHYQEKRLAQVRATHDRHGEGATLNNLGQIQKTKGDYDTALRYLEDSLQIQQQIGDRKGEGATLHSISFIHLHQGDYDAGLRYLEDSLRIRQQIGDRQGEGAAWNSLAVIAIAKGDYDTALRYLEDSLKIVREIGDRQIEGATLNNISRIYAAKGDYDTALRCLEDSLRIRQQIGHRQGIVECLHNLANIAIAKGDYNTALRYLEDTLKIVQQIGARQREGTILNNLGEIHRTKGDYDTALRHLEGSLRIRQQIGDRKGEGVTLNNISQIYDAKGDYDTALRYLEDSLRIRQQIGDIRGMATTMHNMGATLFQDKRQPEAAIPYLLRAYQMRQQIGDPQMKSTEGWLSSIINQIGEARYNQLVAEYQQQSS